MSRKFMKIMMTIQIFSKHGKFQKHLWCIGEAPITADRQSLVDVAI